MTKTAKQIKMIAKKLLETKEIKEKNKKLEKSGIRLTNIFKKEIVPIGMLNEEELNILKLYFKEEINNFYYVERI